MAIINIYQYYNAQNEFIEDNQGATKPNVMDANSIAYYVYEDATVDGVAPTGTTDDAMVDLAHSLLHSNETTLGQAMIDYIITNGFEFTRSSIVPGPTVYTSGETPYIMLKYIECLEKLYEITGTTSYQTLATAIATRLNTNMTLTGSVTYPYAGCSRAVLLYDGTGTLVTTYRSGIYVADINPLAWLLKASSTNVTAAINCIADSQKAFESASSTNGLFMPFYSEDVTENASYTPLQSWLFDGPLGNESSMLHSYRTALNVARYYHTRKKIFSGQRDNVAKVILDKFLTAMYAYYQANGNLPDTLTAVAVDLSDATVELDDLLTLDQLYKSISLSNTADNVGFMAMVGLTALLKFKTDRDEYCFDFANSLIQDLYALQQTDGSIKSGSYTYISDQAYAQEFFYRYINLNNKTYLDLINEALDCLKTENIYTNTLTTHNYSIATSICETGLSKITRDKFWEWSYTETPLTYSVGVNSYDLTSYEVNAHRIENIDFFYQNKYYRLERMNYDTYLAYITRNTTANRPTYFATKGENLYLYPIPDQDYSIEVNHYKEQFEISNFNDYPDLLPAEWGFLLKWYVAWRLALMNSLALTAIFEFIYLLIFNCMTTEDAKDLSAKSQIPSNIDFKEGVYNG